MRTGRESPRTRGRALLDEVFERPARRLIRRLPEARALGSRLVLILLLVEVLFLSVASAAVLAFGDRVTEADASLALAIYSYETPALTALFIGLTLIGVLPVMLIQTSLLFWFLALIRRPLLAWAFLLTMAGEYTLEYLTKIIVQRSRPEIFRLADATGFSFPSGHALAATCLYGFVAILLARRSSSLGWKLATVLVGIVLPLGVGFSRVYLGVHYPSDVLGGWLGGSIWLIAVQVAVVRLPAFKRETVARSTSPRAPRTGAESRSEPPDR